MNKTIHQLEELTQAEQTDELIVYDVSANDTKKIKVQNLVGSYSTSETFTGKYWIDGKPIYRKVFTGLNFGDSTATYANTGAIVSNGDTLINAYAMKDNRIIVKFLGFYLLNDNNITYWTNVAWAGCDTLIAEYTKTS